MMTKRNITTTATNASLHRLPRERHSAWNELHREYLLFMLRDSKGSRSGALFASLFKDRSILVLEKRLQKGMY